jgi:hypothetical protein
MMQQLIKCKSSLRYCKMEILIRVVVTTSLCLDTEWFKTLLHYSNFLMHLKAARTKRRCMLQK